MNNYVAKNLQYRLGGKSSLTTQLATKKISF